ncbi:TasA family protein [Brevibacillus sp. 179-C9.3 HS]|uniref:TasA family protein n=1 Tax=unclassified Brevibacillus TaxID=2684853 RepID=UPI0039A1E5C2
MNLKKQFAVTLASVGLGAALIGGGTFAYFSDQEKVENTFAAGTLDLAVSPSVVFDLKHMKPGDKAKRSYKITNNGTLDIQNVFLTSKYTVTDANNNNAGEDLGKHLRVNIIYNIDNRDTIVWSDTLAELQSKQGKDRPDLLKSLFERTGELLKPKEIDDIRVEIEFVENDKDQNVFQGDSVKLDWTFDATQTKGKEI